MPGSPTRFALPGLLALAATLAAPLAGQQRLYVDDSATGANDGSSWADAFPDLQDALARPGRLEVWVAAGRYTPAPPGGAVTASFVLRSGVALYGGFAGGETARAQRNPAANTTILSGDLNADDAPGWTNMADNSYHVVRADGADASAVLDGFVIERGHATWIGWDGLGGGLTASGASPTLIDCIFRQSLATQAGGVYLLDSHASIVDCLFEGNQAWSGKGGGLLAAGASVLQVRRCEFRANLSQGGSTQGGGGGMEVDWGCAADLADCRFTGNSALAGCCAVYAPSSGGGLLLLGGGSTVLRCEFLDNRAHEGGALSAYADTWIADCLFAGNQAQPGVGSQGNSIGGYAGAVFTFYATVLVEGCTVTANHAPENGGGFYLGTNTVFTLDNSIVWGNTGDPQQPTIKAQISKAPNVAKDYLYSCIQALFEQIPGEPPPNPGDFPGCIDADPLFLAPAARDFRLGAASPCLDAGDTAAVPSETRTDLDGRPRRAGAPALVDMGAFESGPTVPLLRTSRLPAGQPALLRADGFAPGVPVRFGYSLAGLGDGPCPPQLGGLCLDLLPPFDLVGQATADSSGHAELSFVVPAAVPPGLLVHFQAASALGAASQLAPPWSEPVLP